MPNDLSKLSDINSSISTTRIWRESSDRAFHERIPREGTPGVRILQRDAKGVIEGEVRRRRARTRARMCYLTIDARIQYISEEALRAVGRARRRGGGPQ